MDEDERTTLLRVLRTVAEMLFDRGYDVAESEINVTKSEFLEKYGENFQREDLAMIRSKKDDPNDKIYILFSRDLNVAAIRVNVERMKRDDVRKAIFIIQNKPSSPGMKLFQQLEAISVQLFQEEQLLINIKNHELVPRHIVLSDEEKKALLEKYSVKEAQLPRILVSDPMARYYGLRRGQVVKIIRNSETAGKYVTFRCCV